MGMDHVELDTAPDSVFECTHHNYDVSVGATAIRLTTKNTNDLPPFAEFRLSLSTEGKFNIHLLSIGVAYKRFSYNRTKGFIKKMKYRPYNMVYVLWSGLVYVLGSGPYF